ncbi:MAG: AAA family ATPase, partial [Clostridia bacterium]|nr:AAA family ATPase [Clostridia bacterium]
MEDLLSPLAGKIRPESFDEMVGQEGLVGERGVLRRLSAGKRFPSMIFFGPPGTGKTTAAVILAKNSGLEMRHLNATTSSLADVRAVAADADGILGKNGILLYLDEIQYFNKKQQQSLLEYVEDGRITLIASTTENPYFYVYDALLSRCAVFEFKSVSAK